MCCVRGRLRVNVVGEHGCGKTSLVQAIIQGCPVTHPPESTNDIKSYHWQPSIPNGMTAF